LSNNVVEAKNLFNLGTNSKINSLNDTYYGDFGLISGSSSTAKANFNDSTIYCKFIYEITQNIRQQSQDEDQKEAILEWCPRVTASNAEISTESYFGYRIKEIPYNFSPKDLESIRNQLLLIQN
jgi:hypothetical protein